MRVQLEVCATPSEYLDDWLELYARARAAPSNHRHRGVSHKDAFARSSPCPGLVMFKATAEDASSGCTSGTSRATSHTVISARRARCGYELMASYALYAYAIEQFRSRASRWLDWAPLPGIEDDSRRRTAPFQAQVVDRHRQAYLCGRIFQPEPLFGLVRDPEQRATSYFPAVSAREHGGLSGVPSGSADARVRACGRSPTRYAVTRTTQPRA